MPLKINEINVKENFNGSVLSEKYVKNELLKLDYYHKSIIAICKKGEIFIEINAKQYIFSKNQLLIVFPFQKFSFLKRNTDFDLMFVEIPEYVFKSLFFNFSNVFISYFLKNPIITLSKDNMLKIRDYISFIENKVKDKDNFFCGKIIYNSINNIYLEIFNLVMLDCQIKESDSKDIIFENFVNLLMKHCLKNKEVRFYADKLFITPKHLNKIAKKNGDRKTAKEWIDYFVMVEIMSDLNTTHRRLKEIALKNGFSSQTSFYKYFKKHTGISPKEYRKRNMINIQIK